MSVLTSKAQVTIPLKLREFVGLQPGDDVEFLAQGKNIVLRKKRNQAFLDKYAGYLGKGSTEKVMKELRG